jgi:nucleotide-binding universal stress UspA family protein
VSFAATSPLFACVGLHLVIAGGETDKYLGAPRWAREVPGERAVRAEMIQGDADDVLIAGAGNADLVVMGAYGHSRLRAVIVESTTTAVIRGVTLPMPLFR